MFNIISSVAGYLLADGNFGVNGRLHTYPMDFSTQEDAEEWLAGPTRGGRKNADFFKTLKIVKKQ